MHNDDRVLWAINELGLTDQMWFDLADAWIDGGMRCR